MGYTLHNAVEDSKRNVGVGELQLVLTTRLQKRKLFTIAVGSTPTADSLYQATHGTNGPPAVQERNTGYNPSHNPHHRITLPFQCFVLATGWKQSHVTATAQTQHYTSASSYLG
jgi:hypothetical protein